MLVLHLDYFSLCDAVTLYSEICLQRPLPWKTRYSRQKVDIFQFNWTCHQRPPALRDRGFIWPMWWSFKTGAAVVAINGRYAADRVWAMLNIAVKILHNIQSFSFSQKFVLELYKTWISMSYRYFSYWYFRCQIWLAGCIKLGQFAHRRGGYLEGPVQGFLPRETDATDSPF